MVLKCIAPKPSFAKPPARRPTRSFVMSWQDEFFTARRTTVANPDHWLKSLVARKFQPRGLFLARWNSFVWYIFERCAWN
jgi:hypothetical protein